MLERYGQRALRRGPLCSRPERIYLMDFEKDNATAEGAETCQIPARLHRMIAFYPFNNF